MPTSFRCSSRDQAGGVDAVYADRFVLVAGAAACTGRAEHTTLAILDEHGAGLRHELAFANGRQRRKEMRLIFGALDEFAGPYPQGHRGPCLASGNVDPEHAGAVLALRCNEVAPDVDDDH